MHKQYLKQAIASIRENPLVSFLTILGTTLSVAMIMVLVLIYQIRTTSYAPVSNRNKMLYVSTIEGAEIGKNAIWRGALGKRVVNECFYSMKTPALITAVCTDIESKRTSVSGVKRVQDCKVRYTDAAFWKVFDLQFVDGLPYTEEMFQSGVPVVVITDQIAREFYGTTDVAGKTIQLDYIDYKISGVVRTVSEAVNEVYGEIWLPYTLNREVMNSDNAEGICGSLQVYLLAASGSDFKAIKQEAIQQIATFNAGQKQWKANIWGQPVTSIQQMFYFIQGNRMHGMFWGMIMLAALFLFLPIFNLLGLIFSQMQKRRPEIGLRKAFGASVKDIVWQVLWENLFITLIGSIAGLFLSILFFYIAKDSLLERTDVELQMSMFIQPLLFLSALLFCLLINLLSAGIPAWRTAHTTVTDSLNANV